MTADWLDLHLNPDKVRCMNRVEYYKSRSWLRRVRHIIRLRFQNAQLDPSKPSSVFIPATDDVLPALFQ